MPLLLLKILVICTSLLAWVVLSLIGISLLQYNRQTKKVILLTYIVLVLWGVSSYNTWYEGLFLFRKIALVPRLNSWAFTLLTPLFYLYFRYQINNRFPDMRQWVRHFLLPGATAGLYIGISFFNPVPDKLIYSWYEFQLNNSFAWWAFFRVGCYLLLVVQLLVYLPHLSKSIRMSYKNALQKQFIKKELFYIFCFYLISLVSMLTSYYICHILYNLSVLFVGLHLSRQSAFYRIIKRRIVFYLLPHFIVRADKQTEETKIPLLFTQVKEEQVDRLLKSPEYLHNSKLTLKMLARELATNTTSLSHYFNQQLGVRFAQYVATLRMDEAEVLLKDTDMTIIEISEKVGFQTPSTFYQAFNTRHTLSPSQWRKSVKINS